MLDLDELLSRCTFPARGQVANCAVSGGADSSAMLILATHAGCDVTAFHVDHGLRKNSAAEADRVRALADQFRAKFVSLSVEIDSDANLEARARVARHNVLPDNALYAHTADDQAETMIVNLIRGAGLRGLSAMRSDHHPILGLRRAETVAICEQFGVDPVIDITNEDRTILRNRIRHEILPLLNMTAQRDVVEVLSNASEIIRDDDVLLDELAAQIDPTDCHVLLLAPVALARRAIRQWLSQTQIDDLGETHPPSSAAVERVLDVVRNETRAVDVGSGWRVRRSQQKLFLEPADSSAAARQNA